MGWQKWQQKDVREPFHILTITLLSLLLPLSFLLLARLSIAQYLLTFTHNYPFPQPSNSLNFSLFLYTNPTVLHVLVSILTVSTLIHGLTGKITLLSELPSPNYRPHLYTAWIFLCMLQVCVGLGIEGSIAAGVDGTSLGNERSLFSRVIFFLGLQETMLHWSRSVVKPVVDDTVFGVVREEKWGEKAVMVVSFGMLCWWRLNDEVESLVVVAEVKKNVLIDVGVADFVGWWLYYLTVTIGMIRIVKSLMWVGMILLCRRVEGNSGESYENEDKV